MDSWMFWYETNKAPLQNLKRSIYARYDTSNPIHTMGLGGHSNRSDAAHLTRALVRSDVIPALLWAMDPKNAGHQDTESAAYIALAKVTDDPAHIERLQKGLGSKHPITQEASALALGMLRRAQSEDQFTAVELDGVRVFLFEIFEDEKRPVRTRAFAALALGLLGDQPTGSDRHPGAEATTERLFQLLVRPYEHPDLPISLFMAIGMQPPASVMEMQRHTLRTCVKNLVLGDEKVPAYVGQFAALALGRVGRLDYDAMFLQRALGIRRGGHCMQRSVAIALGVLGRHAAPEDRAQIAGTLLHSLKRRRLRDASAKNFAMISLAHLVEADVAEDRTTVLGETKTEEFLLDTVQNGSYTVRPYAALALGLICRAIGDETSVEVYGGFRAEAREVLRNGLAARKIDTHGRAAIAVALGLARDEQSVEDLAALVGDDGLDPQLRGYAALALGHIGQKTPAVLRPIRKALKSRASEHLRRATATALGMLRDREAVPLLLEELMHARSQSTKGGVVLAVARIGDERAVAPLIGVLKDDREQHLTRALACAGLGLVGDLEWLPSLSRISTDVNYRNAGAAIAEVLSIL
jgi:HEAT repeat protein